jgi:hypothetical protein
LALDCQRKKNEIERNRKEKEKKKEKERRGGTFFFLSHYFVILDELVERVRLSNVQLLSFCAAASASASVKQSV